MKRKSFSLKERFEIFKRDFFTCCYCGSKPPKVTLEVDHIVPISKKGTNDIDNLITSCFDCNRGKSNIELSSIPKTLEEKHKILVEKELQYKEYNKFVNKINKRIGKEIDEIDNLYNSVYTEYCLSESFKFSVKKFIQKLGIEEVREAMNKALRNTRLNDRTCLKYFCGICWNKINGI
jgi:hypothetical protein